MKTTIDISDGLYSHCKELIRRERTTLRALVEEGLQIVVRQHNHPKKHSFNPVVVDGQGMDPELESKGWQAIRDEIYRGSGS